MKPLIVANWKMNPKSLAEAERLFDTVAKDVKDVKNVELVFCPPFIYLNNLKIENCLPAGEAGKLKIQLGSQDCFWEEEGPYTGAISPTMLKNLRVAYVIIGHSERRNYFKETDEMINKKIKAVLKAGLKPVLCIGEKKGEDAKQIIDNQLKQDLEGIIGKDLEKIIIAYEPVWAISTSGGKICSSEYAEKMLEFIKQRFNGKIIYGGSVDSKIVNNYLEVGYNGALVGGASLDADEFVKIVKNV